MIKTAEQTYTISAENGAPLNVNRFEPEGTAVGVVLVAPAMATTANYYKPFATWLSGRGYIVYTFDYQGYGASARTPLSEVDADIFTWANDAATMVDHVHETEHDLPLHWLGHSLGGQILPFVDHSKLEDATILCAGTGYWKLSEGVNSVLAPALWYVVAPALIRLTGYYPGKTLNLIGDLPGPVMSQWATWCKNPDYMTGVNPEVARKYSSVDLPLTAISFTDDKTMSEASSLHLENLYDGTEVNRVRLTPAELGKKSIDHFGFFHRNNAEVWEAVLDF